MFPNYYLVAVNNSPLALCRRTLIMEKTDFLIGFVESLRFSSSMHFGPPICWYWSRDILKFFFHAKTLPSHQSKPVNNLLLVGQKEQIIPEILHI